MIQCNATSQISFVLKINSKSGVISDTYSGTARQSVTYILFHSELTGSYSGIKVGDTKTRRLLVLSTRRQCASLAGGAQSCIKATLALFRRRRNSSRSSTSSKWRTLSWHHRAGAQGENAKGPSGIRDSVQYVVLVAVTSVTFSATPRGKRETPCSFRLNSAGGRTSAARLPLPFGCRSGAQGFSQHSVPRSYVPLPHHSSFFIFYISLRLSPLLLWDPANLWHSLDNCRTRPVPSFTSSTCALTAQLRVLISFFPRGIIHRHLSFVVVLPYLPLETSSRVRQILRPALTSDAAVLFSVTSLLLSRLSTLSSSS